MFKKVRFLIGLVLVLAMTNTALAQEPVTPQHSDPTWRASYWNNTSLSGTPALQRSETSLDHDWGNGSPHPDVVSDGFSARWTRYIDVEPGLYRFSATSDDGIRVYVDNDLIINEWHDHAAKTVSAEKHLSTGHHWVVVEFYENGGLAVARLTWAPVSTPTYHWKGEYFNNASLSGAPALVRDDERIDFNWGNDSPAPGVIGGDRFSVRWTQTLDLPAGHYRFAMTVDDGGRLWVNDHLLIESWRDQPARTYIGDIYLSGGSVPIKMEYYENGGYAVARLIWTQDDGPTPPPPPSGTVIVDDTDPGFVTGGSASGLRKAYEGHGGRLTWTRNNDWERPNYNWARWYPSLEPGRYEVFAFVPDRYTTTSNARYWIAHADGYALRTVDQSANGDRWVSLGTYRFDGKGGEYVSLSDVTYESRLSRLIAFDAIKWVPR
jgi:hypothetical protein